jgi:hypothetical protein
MAAVAYVWAESENYWPGHAAATPAGAYGDPFSAASGLALFSAAQRELDAAGVRTPQVYLTDESGAITRRTSRSSRTSQARA